MERGSSRSAPRRVVSVRTRLVAVITIVAALGMLSVGTAVYLVERARILAQIDERLEANLESVRYIVQEATPTGVDGKPRAWADAGEALESVVRRMSPDDNTGAVGIVEGRAALVPGVALDVDLLAAPGFIPFLVDTVQSDARRGTYAEEGVAWRYLAVPIQVEGPAPDTVVFAMAYDLNAELAEFEEPTRVYLIATAIALVVIAGVATLVAGRLLRPLRRMRETAERVSAQSLSERLPVEGRDDVSELARTMNAMLDRIDGAMDSQRRLLSDVGHELKTPITIVRGYVEVMDPEDPRDVRDTQDLAIDELDRMDRLVRDLAAAATLHGRAPVTPREVDAGDLVAQIVRKAEGIDGATVAAGVRADVVAHLDPARITQAMLQLAQNAVTHGGGNIVIGSSVTGSTLTFWVRDHGPGVAPDQRAEVFARFHRGADSQGSGLGLNIVQVIARAHGGEAEVVDPPSGAGALFRLSVPLAAAPSTHDDEESADGVDPDR